MQSKDSDEKKLVIFLSEGNEEAFEELYHLYGERLICYLIKFVKSESLAAEILQEAFIKIWNNRKNLDPDQSFRSYLFRIAENLVYDFFRKAARDKKLEEMLVNKSATYSHVEETIFTKENNEFLQAAIRSLPPKRRQVFQMIKMEEKSYEEVSVLLNVSTSTINDHIVKATKSVIENLERCRVIELSVISFAFCLNFFFPG